MNSSSKIALVTGGTDGIGKALVIKLVAEGYKVVFVGKSAEKADILLRELREKFPAQELPKFIQADLSLMKEVERVSNQITDSFPNLEIWISSAGAVFDKPEHTLEGIEKTFALNCLGRYHMMNKLSVVAPQTIIFIAGPEVVSKGIEPLQLENINRLSSIKSLTVSMHYLDLIVAEKMQKMASTFILIHPGPTKGTALMRNSNAFIKLIISVIAQPLNTVVEKITPYIRQNGKKSIIINRWKPIEFNKDKMEEIDSTRLFAFLDSTIQKALQFSQQ